MATDASDPKDAMDPPDPAEKVKLASWVAVKRTKRFVGEGVYGKRGILALTRTKLVFMASGRTLWEIETSSIANVTRPWWGMGSYVTFDVNGSFYGLMFGARGLPSLVSGSDLAVRFGGTIGAGAGILGDAVAVAGMRRTAKLTQQWFDLLSQLA